MKHNKLNILKNILLMGFLIPIAMIFISMTANAQSREITGKITDESGPITGATVKVKNTSTGTFSDLDGTYKITVKDNNAVLEFSFLGYETVEKSVGNQTTIDVVLRQMAVEMDELVVVGYGIQRKSHLTGAITKFDPQAILNIPTSDIATALQGRLSGVTIQNISSEVGVAPEIRVRGAGAMNSGSSPLVVVDNFVMEDGLQMILRSNWTSDNTLTYLKRFGDHDFNVMAGISVEQWKTKLIKLTGTGFPNDYVKTLSAATSFMVLDANGNRLSTTELMPDENLFSYLGRVNYGYKDRYLASAVLRADGFSYFGDNQKWGYFPSLSLGWRVSEESFMKNIKPVSALKLRASYGLTGDNSVPYNATKNLLYSTLYSFGDGTGTASTGLANTSTLIGNPDLGWAKTREVNLGMDLGLIKNRINLTLDYYYSTTQDMLFLRPTSSITGHSQLKDAKLPDTGIGDPRWLKK